MDKIVFAFPLISILITFFIGLFIFVKDSKKSINLFFFLMTLSLSLWMVFNFSEDVQSFSSFSNILVKFDFFFAPVAAYCFYLFSQVVPQPNWRSLTERVIIFLISVSLSIIPFFHTALIKSVEFVNGSQAEFTPLIWVYGLVLAAILLFGCSIIFRNYARSSGIEKKQALYLLIGFFFLSLFVLVSNLILPNIYFSLPLISRLGFIGVIIFITFCSYSILKHHLFDVRVILTETATGLVILTLLTQTILDTSGQRITDVIILGVVSYGGYLLIKSAQDEIKKKEKLQELTIQLGQANAHLQELDKMKTEFVSLASHELLTPTSAIEGYLSMVLDEHLVEVTDPKLAQYLDRVYRSAKRLARLIADMLNISRIEEGRLLVEKKDVDLTELIKQVIEELKFKSEEHKQKMEFADPKVQMMTFADPDKVKEILVNIIGNAIKYTLQPGTIHITIEKVPTAKVNEDWGKIESVIRSSTVDDQESIHAVADEHMKQILGDQQYLIKVKDEGVGIPKEELTKLFKKFHRVGNFSTQESQGTGLGLYITRALVELHHGRVWPDSEGMGKGSTFSFSLPVYDTKQAIIDLEAQSPQTKEQLKPLARTMANDDSI